MKNYTHKPRCLNPGHHTVVFTKVTIPLIKRLTRRKLKGTRWWERFLWKRFPRLGIGKPYTHAQEDLRSVMLGPPYPEELFREVAEHMDEVREQLKNEKLKSKTNQ